MDVNRPLFVPVLLGTVRRGRMSAPVANVIRDELTKRPGVETELIDIAELDLAVDDAGEAIKIPELAETIDKSDGLVIVTPEYNHGYPGLLKHTLDSNYWEYVHKAVGIAAVSRGPFGGTRVAENLLSVVRALGMVPIVWDVNFSNVGAVFDHHGRLADDRYLRRIDKFLSELLWMARTLRYGRENIQVVSS